MKHLLLVYGGHVGGRVEAMTQAVQQGVAAVSGVEIRSLPALQATADDVLWAQGLLVGTPEHFGYMSGAVKDFFDRTFYPVESKTVGLPYALYVSAGNDGTGAVGAIERIVLGLKWKRIAEPLIVRGNLSTDALEHCRELGQTMAAGLEAGIF
jgi:flavorubredoxin